MGWGGIRASMARRKHRHCNLIILSFSLALPNTRMGWGGVGRRGTQPPTGQRDNGNGTTGQRDNGTTGQRGNGTTGQRDTGQRDRQTEPNGTTGQRDNGITGQRDTGQRDRQTEPNGTTGQPDNGTVVNGTTGQRDRGAKRYNGQTRQRGQTVQGANGPTGQRDRGTEPTVFLPVYP